MDVKQAFCEAWRTLGPKYSGQSLRIYHEPYLISQETASFFRSTVEPLQKIVEKITDLFVQGQFRDVLQFDLRLQDLILHDPGYPLACPFNRWDSYYDGNALKFLELNTDGTSGMVYTEALDQLYTKHFETLDFQPCEFKRNILKTLINCYKEFRNKRSEKPQMALVDWHDVSTRAEQETLVQYFNAQGYKAILSDPRSLRYDGTCLWMDDFRIDLIYRRVVTREYIERWEEIKSLTQAYLDWNVCLVGSFRSQVGFDKRTFEVLSSPEYDPYFTEAENNLRQMYIPWTRVLKQDQSWFPEVYKNRDKFVLKPSNLNRGEGVILGYQMNDAPWCSKLKGLFGKDYIVQERVEIPLWSEKGYGLHLGHFVFGRQLAGWMCRVAKDPLLSDRSDDLLVPCLQEGSKVLGVKNHK